MTLFPEAFSSYIGASIIGRAIKDKKVKISFYNPRDFTTKRARGMNKLRLDIPEGAQGGSLLTKNKHKRVDQKPYGGGPGMVLEAESILRAVQKAMGRKKNIEVIFFDTSGKEFTNTYARTLTKKYQDVILICGHYEGVDARVQKILKAKKVSVGDYTLTGGELPAMAVVDAVSRQIPGVLGNFDSLEEERVSSPEVYTRPEVFEWKGKKWRVPKVLLSGNHKAIAAWKHSKRGR